MPPTLHDALQHHKAGDLAKAAQLYQAILLADPRHADAYHLLGVLMHQLQQSQVAAELIGCAIEINGAFAPYHNNLGNALLALGNTEQARACFQRSIALHCSADGYINLATLELGDGRSSEARAAFKAALRLDPKRVEGLVGLGRLALMDSQTSPAKRWLEKALAIAPCCISALTLLGDTHLQQERFSEAEKYYARATECSPSDTEAHLKMGHLKMRLQHYASAAECYAKAHLLNPENHRVAILLGSAHLMNDDPGAAADAFTRALQIDDRHAESHHLLGSALTLRRDYEQALVSFERALSLDPELHEVRNGMGNAYSGRGDYPRAASAFEAALALQSRNPTYLMNVGINLGRQGNRRAIAVLDEAIALAPDDASIHVALAEALLSFGDYKRGFDEYDWRWRSPSFSKPHRQFDGPVWDGAPLAGKTILLHAEQGLGDTIQFVRFVPQVAHLGGSIVLVVQPQLFRLFEALPCIAICLRDTDPIPPFDVRCPLLSLPAVLGTELATIPEPIGLSGVVCSDRSQKGNVLSVGLVWTGNPDHKRDHLRSMPLAPLLPLQDIEHCRFFSLQKDIPANDQATLHAFAMPNVLDDCHDFLDTSNAIRDLDLIISVDTSVAHLAATLGKEVWLILPEAADWRWGVAGQSTSWYPTMKLFRKMPGETNDSLMKRLVRALEEKLSFQQAA